MSRGGRRKEGMWISLFLERCDIRRNQSEAILSKTSTLNRGSNKVYVPKAALGNRHRARQREACEWVTDTLVGKLRHECSVNHPATVE